MVAGFYEDVIVNAEFIDGKEKGEGGGEDEMRKVAISEANKQDNEGGRVLLTRDWLENDLLSR